MPKMPDETADQWKERATSDVSKLERAAENAKGGSQLEQAAANESLAIGRRNRTAAWNGDNDS